MRHSYLDSFSKLKSPIHQLDARVKIILLLALTVISVTTPAYAYFAFAGYFGLLVFLIFLSRLPVAHVTKRSLVVVPFVLMVVIFVPFLKGDSAGSYNLGLTKISHDGLLIVWNVTVKSLIGVLSMILLSSTTPFDKLLRGFEDLKVPRVFIAIASFMYRYSFVLADEAMRMKVAADSRNLKSQWVWDAKFIGHIIAYLFLRSYERGERVYLAMVARGYDGTTRTLAQEKISLPDFAFLGTSGIILILLRVLGT